MGDLNGQSIEERFQPMLFSDEYIVRCGESKQVGSGASQLPFAIFWTGFSIFWTAAAFASGAGFSSLFGLPFIAIGIFLFVQIFKGGSKEYYALTNLRVIILSGKATHAEYYDRIGDARVYPGAKKGIFAVRISLDVEADINVLSDINVEDSYEAENLCRDILSEKERYINYKNEQRK